MGKKITENVSSPDIQEFEQLTLISLFITIKRNLKYFLIGIALVFFISLFVVFISIFTAYTQHVTENDLAAAAAAAEAESVAAVPVPVPVPVVLENPIVNNHYIFIEPGMIVDKNYNKVMVEPLPELIYKVQRIYMPKAILDLVSYKTYTEGNLEFRIESQGDVNVLGILFEEKLAAPKNLDYPAILNGVADRILNDQQRAVGFLTRSNSNFIPGRVIESGSIDVRVDEIEVLVEKNIETTNNYPSIHSLSPTSPSFMDFVEGTDKKLLLIPILGLIIGVLLGLVLVFVVEFLRRVKEVEDEL